MEENFNKKPEPSVQKPKKQETGTETKKKKAKVAVITLSTIVVLFLGLQVYASTNGYGNVFFMIKNLITTGNPAGNQEIFSDKDITLSYKSIDLAEGLKIQANRLEIKDGKTKIFLSVKSQDAEPLPLKYETITNSNDGKSTTTKINTTGQKPEETEYIYYDDIIELSYEVKESDTIVLKISDSKDKELRTLEINLETREITVRGEKDFEKISQIELKKYLSLFSELNNGTNESDVLLSMAETLIDVGGEYEGYGIVSYEDYREALNNNTRMEIENQIIKEIYGDKAKFETIKTSKGQEVEVLKGISNYQLMSNVSWMDSIENEEEQYFSTTDMADYKHGKCLKIEDASYENDIYTIKYVYTLVGANDENLEDLPQYETTIKLKRKEDNKFSKYEIVSLESGTEVNNKVDTDAKEDDNIDELDNNHDKHYYSVVENSGSRADQYGHTSLDGTHIEKCIVCGEERRVPHNFGKWFILEGGAYTLWCEDCKNYVFTTDYNFVKNSGYGINEKDNSSTTNIANNEDINNLSDEIKDKLTNPEKWTQFSYGEGSGIWNIKMPYTFAMGKNYSYERYKTQYYEGWMLNRNNTIDWGLSEDKAEKVPVTIKFDVTISDNMYPGSDAANKWLSNDEDRMVKSTDNNGWTDWYPVRESSRLTQNGFVREYGRVGNGQFETVEFEFTTNSGCGTEIYKFMGNVLSSVKSKGLR
ncbi:MAG: hypothetical protein J5881_04275 [Clostridia bacterium]|nr:hypothetical protein [Clostridia bacterium]